VGADADALPVDATEQLPLGGATDGIIEADAAPVAAGAEIDAIDAGAIADAHAGVMGTDEPADAVATDGIVEDVVDAPVAVSAPQSAWVDAGAGADADATAAEPALLLRARAEAQSVVAAAV
jgi:hypothetical protein